MLNRICVTQWVIDDVHTYQCVCVCRTARKPTCQVGDVIYKSYVVIIIVFFNETDFISAVQIDI